MSEQNHRQLCEACLEKEYETYRHARVHESMERNDAWLAKFKVGDWPRWDYDLEAETLTFSEDGHPRVTADIVVVGTVQKSEWEWAWGNQHMPVRSRDRMTKVREFGKEKQWAKLTSLFLESDDYLGWECSSIAAHLLGADGAYRCPDSEGSDDFIYVLAFNTRFVQ